MNARQISSLICTALVGTGLLNGVASLAVAQNELFRYVPQDANVVIGIDLEGVERGQLDDNLLMDQFSQHREHLPFYTPAGIREMIFAAEFDWDSVSSEWEVGIAKIGEAKLRADAFDGRLLEKQCCKIDGIQFLQLSQNTVGLMWPAKRQKVSRWVRRISRRDGSSLSPYLASVFDSDTVPNRSNFQIAVDLTDAIDANTYENYFSNLEVLHDSQVDLKNAIELFSSLRGIRISCDFGQENKATISLDFMYPVKQLDAIAKPLLLELMEKSAVWLPEANQWQLLTKEKQLSLTGQISDEGIRKLSSLIGVGPTNLRSLLNQTVLNESSKLQKSYLELSKIRESKHYVSEIQQMVADLKDASHENRVLSSSFRLFVDRYARKIQHLPTRNVDSSLLVNGEKIAEDFYELASSIQDATLLTASEQTATVGPITYSAIPYREFATVGQRYYRYAPYATWSVDPTQNQRVIEALRSSIRGSTSETIVKVDSLLEKMKADLEMLTTSDAK